MRGGILADETGAMKLYIWEDLFDQLQEDIVYQLTSLEVRDYFGLKLTTTSMTSIKKNAIEINVDWSLHDVETNEIELFCLLVDSIKMNESLQCVNAGCRRKVVPFFGKTKVLYTNQSCNRRMLVSRCTSQTIFELTLTSKDSHKKHMGAAFFKTVDRVIPIKDLSQEEIKDKLLEIQLQ